MRFEFLPAAVEVLQNYVICHQTSLFFRPYAQLNDLYSPRDVVKAMLSSKLQGDAAS